MTEQGKAVTRRFFDEVFSRGRLDAVDELFAVDYQDHDPVNEQDIHGPEGVREEIALYRAGIPDLSVTVEDQLSDGDHVVTRWIARGAHDGQLLGTPPTGNPIEVHGITIHRVVGGRIEEGWWNWDVLGLMSQIGAIPAEQAA